MLLPEEEPSWERDSDWDLEGCAVWTSLFVDVVIIALPGGTVKTPSTCSVEGEKKDLGSAREGFRSVDGDRTI
jgi:hypothetical protein